MKTNHKKNIGVWLDHSKAVLIDLTQEKAIIKKIHSDKESQIRFRGEHGLGTQLGNYRSTNNEHHQHNRKQKLMHEYYHLLSECLIHYDEILLFGPTTAKKELYNKLKTDKHFEDKNIHIQSTDVLSENQMIAATKIFFLQNNIN
jgi:hypothetical protein